MVGTAAGANAEAAQLVRAGVEWDVIKVTRYLALRALESLPSPGAVIVEPHPARPALYFFVPAGSTACWRLPQTVPLAGMTHLALPPEGKVTPPGPYWLIPLTQGLTLVCELRHALEGSARTGVDGTAGRLSGELRVSGRSFAASLLSPGGEGR